MSSASPFAHFTNQSATNTGAVLDIGAPSTSVTVQLIAGTGVSAGAVTLSGSLNGVTFTQLSGAVITGKSVAGVALANGIITFTAASSVLVSTPNAGGVLRYIRADVTTTVVGGTISAYAMGL